MNKYKYKLILVYSVLVACFLTTISVYAAGDIDWSVVNKSAVYEQLERIIGTREGEPEYNNRSFSKNDDENGKIIRALKTIDKGIIVDDGVSEVLANTVNTNTKLRTNPGMNDAAPNEAAASDNNTSDEVIPVNQDFIEAGNYSGIAKELLESYYNDKAGKNLPIFVLFIVSAAAAVFLLIMLLLSKKKERTIKSDGEKLRKDAHSKSKTINELKRKNEELEQKIIRKNRENERLADQYDHLSQDQSKYAEERAILHKENLELKQHIDTISHNSTDIVSDIKEQIPTEPQEENQQQEKQKKELEPCNLNPVSGGVEIVPGSLMLAEEADNDTVYIYASELAHKQAVRNAISSYFEFSVIDKKGEVHNIHPCILKRNAYNYSIVQIGFIEIK